MTRRLASLLACLFCSVISTTALAQTGATVTPDGETNLVNKDVNAERWTIALTRVPGNPRILNVSGTVFRTDGGPPSFVACQVLNDRADLLTDPSAIAQLHCKGAGPCAATARECSQNDWTELGTFELPVSFFLPRRSDEVASGEGAGGWTGGAAERLLALVDGLRAQLARAELVATAQAQGDDRGSTLTYDGNTFLVSKDLGTQRWSIALNLDPSNQSPRDVTGNVFETSGATPSFIYCRVRSDSQGNLNDPDSTFRFQCLGTGACETSAEACTRTWQEIPGGDRIEINASFFLPELGLPAAEPSDGGLIGIGTKRDPGSYNVNVPAPPPAAPGGTVAAVVELGEVSTLFGECAVGNLCQVEQIGTCSDLSGTLQRGPRQADGTLPCVCSVDVPFECVTCEANQCGANCTYPAGDLTARGICLPFSSESTDCACQPIPPDAEQTTAPTCGGPLVGLCGAGDFCCADDPIDGCALSSGDIRCDGVCVDANGCDPRVQECGICGSAADQPQPVCGNEVVEGGEQCDGKTILETCGSLFLGEGTLRCTSGCRLDTSGCVGVPVTDLVPETPETCGNGVLDPDEVCDGSFDDCTDECGSEANVQSFVCRGCAELTCGCFDQGSCGDGRLNNDEECDGSSDFPDSICAGACGGEANVLACSGCECVCGGGSASEAFLELPPSVVE